MLWPPLDDFNKSFNAPSARGAREAFIALPPTVLERTRDYCRPWKGAPVVGAVAVTDRLLQQMEPFHNRLEAFFEPTADLDVTVQLGITAEFWRLLGRTMPELSPEQHTSIKQVLAVQPPGWRVVPTCIPKDFFEERAAVAARAKATFPKQRFHPSYVPLHPANKAGIYGQLVREPGEIVKTGQKFVTTYALGYRTSDDEWAVTRAEYLRQLVETGAAVPSDDGSVWLFPVLDVAPLPSEVPYAASQDPGIRAPEVFIALNLLQQANGMPNLRYRDRSDQTNEAIYGYHYEALEGVNGDDLTPTIDQVFARGSRTPTQVGWYEESGRTFVDAYDLNSPGYGPYQRPVANGIGR